MSTNKAEELRFLESPDYWRRKQLTTDSDDSLADFQKSLRRDLVSRREALERTQAILAVVETEMARRTNK
jgi:hypothetical protein